MTYQNRETYPRAYPKGARMGRGHFKLIAGVLRAARPQNWRRNAQWQQLVIDFANALQTTNRGFKHERFKEAAGFEL